MHPDPAKAYMIFKYRHVEDLKRAEHVAQLPQDHPPTRSWLARIRTILRNDQPYKLVPDPAPESDALTAFDHIQGTV